MISVKDIITSSGRISVIVFMEPDRLSRKKAACTICTDCLGGVI